MKNTVRQGFAMILIAVALMFSAGSALADDIIIDLDNRNDNVNTAAANSAATATGTGGNAVVNFRSDHQREFAPTVGGYQVYGPSGINTSGNRWIANASAVNICMQINQGSFNNMVAFLDQSHEMDSATRTWKDLRDDLVIQPRFDYPKSPLGDEDYVSVTSASQINLAGLSQNQIVGFITVRDKEPEENPVDKMYLSEALYPYARLGGANVLVKIDDYFREKVSSGAFGGGVGGVLAHIISCATGGTVAANIGGSKGSVIAHMAGGEQYLALRMAENPCIVKVPVAQSAPKTCDPSGYLKELEKIEQRIAVCFRYSYDNMLDRLKAGSKSFELYLCTGEARYLLDAIQHYQMGELNYIHGFDIKANSNSKAVIAEIEYWLASSFYARDHSIDAYWQAPDKILHQNKKTGKDKWTTTTAYERAEITKIRRTLERYSTNPTMK